MYCQIQGRTVFDMSTSTELDRRGLKRRRIEAGLNQTQLAQRAGVSKQLLSMVENGNANFSPAYLGKIAKALNCTIADLLTGEDEAPATDIDSAGAA